MKRIRTFLILTLFLVSMTGSAFAAGANTEQQTAASYLREAGIMVGNETGDMMLDQGLTRAQMAAVLTRIVANPDHVEADSAYYRGQCKFTDVPDWAKVYVGYCAANHLVAGYGNGLYGPSDPVTPAAACTVMLRCLGDVDMEWTYSTACQTAVELGLSSAEALTGAEITRGNMAVLIYRTMAKMGYDIEVSEAPQSATPAGQAISRNDDGSINVPSDGSRYDIQMIPCCGHTLIANDDLTEVAISGCDTGTDWTTIHEGNAVRFILPSGQEEVVTLREYQYEVLDFAKSVKRFYDACTPKEIPENEFDRNGYTAFWKEWQRRYNDGLMLLSLETGREMELSHDGLHYFVSHKDGDWSLYCEESKEMQLFPGWYALYENARFGDKLLRDEIASVCFDAIL